MEQFIDVGAVRDLDAWAATERAPALDLERLVGHVVVRFGRRASADQWTEAAQRARDQLRSAPVQGIPFDALWGRLAAIADPTDRREWVAVIERVAAAGADGLGPVAAARETAIERARLPGAPRRWERGTGRSLTVIAALAKEILASTERLYRVALDSVVNRELAAGSLQHHWVDMPRYLAGFESGSDLPAIDGRLLDFVASEAGVASIVEERVRITGSARERHTTRVVVVEPGREVRICFVGGGPLADLRGMLRAAGMALAAGLGPAGPPARARFPDPAVVVAWGTLFELLASSSTWLEHMLNRPAPAALGTAAETQALTRLRLHAACLSESSERTGEWLDLPWASGPPATEATGFQHPVGVLPRAPSVLEAADELAGHVGAAMLEDHLATRFGRLWSRQAPAIRFLREIWHEAGNLPLQILLADVGAGELDVSPLVQRVRGCLDP